MLVALVFVTILSIAATEDNKKLISINREDGWDDEVEFWSKAACRTGRKRTFSLHEIPEIDSSRRLHDFYRDLVTNVQSNCVVTMTTIFYRDFNYTYPPKAANPFETKRHEEIFTKLPMVIEKKGNATKELNSKTRLFSHCDVEILMMLMEDSARILMDSKVLKDWDNRRHIVVLMITKERETSNSSKLLIDTFTVLLQRLWHERQLLNVHFAAPFSSFGHLIWFYDPFYKNATSGIRGKIVARKVSKIPRVHRVINLYGYKLNVGMFEAQPAAIKYFPKNSYDFPYAKSTQDYVGVDGLTMEAIAKHMNFTIKIVPPKDGIEFGYVDDNGTYIGTIGDAAYHRIDIGFNSMYTKLYKPLHNRLNTIEFTVPIDFDRLCVIVPRAQKIPRWLRSFYYFDTAIWVCLVITQFVVALAWYLIRNVQASPTKKIKNRSSYRSLLMATVFLFIGAPVNLKVSQVEKIILSSLLMFGVTIMGTFTGTLYHSFTNEMYYKEILSLKALDQSGIPIRTASPNLHDVFGLVEMDDDPEEVRNLRRKLKVIEYDNTSTIEKTAYRRNVASLSRENSFAVTRYRYVDEMGDSLLHLVPDCPRSYYLSYVMPRNSVYTGRVNKLVRRLLQAGLPPLWNSITMDRLINLETATAKLRRSNTDNVPFNLRDMQTSFFILAMGHTVAACVLIGEIFCKKKRKPAQKQRWEYHN